MKAVCEEDSGEGAEDVGEPVEGVVAGASRGECLVPFVEHADEGEDGEGEDDAEPERSATPFSQEDPSGEAGRPAHEVSKMNELIEVGDFRTGLGHSLRERRKDEEGDRPAEEGCEPKAG